MFEWLFRKKTKKENKKSTEQRIQDLERELMFYRQTEKEYDDKRNSSDPWVEIIGESIDPVKGIQISLDWNDAFIQYLREQGITDKDEDAVVQKWLTMLYKDLMDRFENIVIDNKEQSDTNDFE